MMRALIVDDQPNVRVLLSRILRKQASCHVVEAGNGLEALDRLARIAFDVVILDVLMPVMDGIETLAAIRRSPSLRHLPVVMLSAVRDESKVRHLVQLGITAYLAKPLRPQEVSIRLRDIIDRLSGPVAPRARDFAPVKPGARVLVIDGDPAFREAVREALRDYAVFAAGSGSEGLRACQNVRPAVVIVGEQLGAVSTPALLRRVRHLPDVPQPRLVAAVPRDVTAAGSEADTVIPRVLEIDVLRRQFARMVVDPPPDHRVVAARADLRPEIEAATEQLFGMMLGIDVVAAPVTTRPTCGDDLATVRFRLADEPCDLEFGLIAPRAVSERLTARYLHTAEVVDDGDVARTLGEVAGIIAARVQTALRQRGDAVTMAEPVVSRLDREEDESAVAALRASYVSRAQDLCFMSRLRAIPRDCASGPDMLHIPQSTDMNDTQSPVPPVDPEVLEMLASLQEPGEPDLLTELVTLFLRDTPERLRELAGGPLEPRHAARVAHAVKGSAGNLGATRMQELAQQLEQAGQRDASAEELGTLAAAIVEEFGRVETHLRGVLAERGGAVQ